MNGSQKIIAGAAFTAVMAMGDLQAVQAEDLLPGSKTMKPLYAVSFDVGGKHVLSYFLKKKGRCDLTMMVTDRQNAAESAAEIPALATSRIKAEIMRGKTASFGIDPTTGKALEYACSVSAEAMSVRETYPMANTEHRPLYPYHFNQTASIAAGLGG